MKTAVITAVLTGIFVIPAYAVDSTTDPQGSGQNIEQKKSEILQHIDQRIANSQAEKVCVQAAKSHDEIKACREKYRPKSKADNQNRNQ
jgi:hypothetical protein